VAHIINHKMKSR